MSSIWFSFLHISVMHWIQYSEWISVLFTCFVFTPSLFISFMIKAPTNRMWSCKMWCPWSYCPSIFVFCASPYILGHSLGNLMASYDPGSYNYLTKFSDTVERDELKSRYRNCLQYANPESQDSYLSDLPLYLKSWNFLPICPVRLEKIVVLETKSLQQSFKSSSQLLKCHYFCPKDKFSNLASCVSKLLTLLSILHRLFSRLCSNVGACFHQSLHPPSVTSLWPSVLHSLSATPVCSHYSSFSKVLPVTQNRGLVVMQTSH